MSTPNSDSISPAHDAPLMTWNSLSPIYMIYILTRLQHTPSPLSGILLLQLFSPWSPINSSLRIHGHHNPNPVHQRHTHIHTINLNDSRILNDTNTPIWYDTLILNDPKPFRFERYINIFQIIHITHNIKTFYYYFSSK